MQDQPNELEQEEFDEAALLARQALRAGKRPFWENPLYIWAVQGVIAGCLVLLIGYMTLWMDNHNDSRYIKREDDKDHWAQFLERYKTDSDYSRSDRTAIRDSQRSGKDDLEKKLDNQQRQLDIIAADIKSLLRQPAR